MKRVVKWYLLQQLKLRRLLEWWRYDNQLPWPRVACPKCKGEGTIVTDFACNPGSGQGCQIGVPIPCTMCYGMKKVPKNYWDWVVPASKFNELTRLHRVPLRRVAIILNIKLGLAASMKRGHVPLPPLATTRILEHVRKQKETK